MNGVTELGYIGLGVSDLEAWKAFASEILGLEVVPGDDPRSCALRMDYWFQRIILTETGTDDIAFAGWRVANEEAFEVTKHRFEQAGVPFEVASPEQAAERHVLGLMKLNDPDGTPVEIFYGPRIEAGSPVYPGRRMHASWVTGDGGLGHIVTNVADPKKCEEFYVGLLGMKGSVETEISRPGVPVAPMSFMSCNSRQHSIAFGRVGGNRRLQHLMTEAARLEDVGLTRDIVKRRSVPIMLDIGQHHNDRAVSFYFVTPSGWHWEVGWGVVPPTGQAEWGKFRIWGHEFFPPAPPVASR